MQTTSTADEHAQLIDQVARALWQSSLTFWAQPENGGFTTFGSYEQQSPRQHAALRAMATAAIATIAGWPAPGA